VAALKQFVFVFITWAAVSVLYVLRIPMGFKSFWAEDGSLFYQEAVEKSFLETLKSPTGGYLCLIGRIGGEITSYFPVQNATFVNFLLATLIMAVCIVTVFNHSKILINNCSLRLLAAIGLVFIPAASFDSLANLANLHFTLPFVLLIILISSRENSKASSLSVFLIILACLSDPLCIFCFPALLYLKTTKRRLTFNLKKSVYTKVYLASMVIQLLFTVVYLSQGVRTLGQDHSVVKTLYLFLDRVIGSTFIPGWGRVSSSDFSEGSLTSKLLIRAVAASIILVLWLLIYFKLIKKERLVLDKTVFTNRNVSLFQVLVSSLTYWFTAGIAFNPEPRYGIFPSLCLLIAAISIVDRILDMQRSPGARKFTLSIFFILISSTWILSWTPSSHRINGPEWRDEIERAVIRCSNSDINNVKLQILPEKGNWFVEVPCTYLIQD